ncbi:ADP-ribosylation family protein [Yinghuangia aomiensis]
MLDLFDRELVGLAHADLVQVVQRDVPRWLPDAVRRAHGGPGVFEPTPEDRLLAAIFGTGEPEPSVWDRARERLYCAQRAAADRVFLRWKAETAQAEDHAGLRRAAAERVRRDRPAIEQRCRDVWGVALPDSLFRFWEFLLALGPVERTAFGDDLGLYVCGIMAVFEDPAWQPADGADPRMHWRYYWDPPEFVTFLNGSYPGEHYGLWFDDGHTSTGVLSHSPKDNSDFGFPAGGTPLEVVRAKTESFSWTAAKTTATETVYPPDTGFGCCGRR